MLTETFVHKIFNSIRKPLLGKQVWKIESYINFVNSSIQYYYIRQEEVSMCLYIRLENFFFILSVKYFPFIYLEFQTNLLFVLKLSPFPFFLIKIFLFIYLILSKWKIMSPYITEMLMWHVLCKKLMSWKKILRF